MRPTVLHSPGPHGTIPQNRFLKFEREHAFRSLFRFWSIYSPIGLKKIENFFYDPLDLKIIDWIQNAIRL